MTATTFFIARGALEQNDSGQWDLCNARANDEQQSGVDVSKGSATQ